MRSNAFNVMLAFTMENFDEAIIGQGLAGSILAWSLLRAGRRVIVIDDDHRSAASTVAAGLINPLAGRRLIAHEHTEKWLAAARDHYANLENALFRRYFHERNMERIFQSAEQVKRFEKQSKEEKASSYFGHRVSPHEFGECIRAPLGGFTQKQAAYVDIASLLNDLRDYFEGHGALRRHAIEYSEITMTSEHVKVAGISARRVIFCEGHRMTSNPWFSYLQVQPDKGELLTIAAGPTLTTSIINGSYWLLPLSNGAYRLGATHAHDHRDELPTKKAYIALRAGLTELLTSTDDIRILDQRSGIRAGTPNRHPFVGTHPQYPQLHIFNGFGGRGALTIPWYADRFTRFLLQGVSLPEEADIGRVKTNS